MSASDNDVAPAARIHCERFRGMAEGDRAYALSHLREAHEYCLKNEPARWTAAELIDAHETWSGGHVSYAEVAPHV